MKTRGRDSAAAQSIVVGGFAQRPDPPDELTARQDAIWREVVASEHPDFFNSAGCRGLLAGYCRSRATCEEISHIIDKSGGVWMLSLDSIDERDMLLRMRDREIKQVVMLATKLRLTNQSRYVTQSAAIRAAKVPPEDVPWRKSA